MKKLVLALSLIFAFSASVFADEAVFQSMDAVEEVQKVNLEPVGSEITATATSTTSAVNGSIQEQSFKKAITNLDDASAEIREQLVNYNTQLATAEEKSKQAKLAVKELKQSVKTTKKKLKNVEKSKKYINASFDVAPEQK